MNLVTGQKFPVFSSNSISQLSEIRMFTTEDEKPLEEIFQNAYTLLEGKPTDFDPKKADNKVLFDMLAKVLPNYDTERVHASDAKKLFSWYNILLSAGKLTPTEEDKAEETAEAAEKLSAPKQTTPKHAATPKQAAPKATTQAKSAPKRTTTAKKAI